MTLRESIFLLLLEDKIKEIRKNGHEPVFEICATAARVDTVSVTDSLKGAGWLM